jgi:hypothetical protein
MQYDTLKDLRELAPCSVKPNDNLIDAVLDAAAKHAYYLTPKDERPEMVPPLFNLHSRRLTLASLFPAKDVRYTAGQPLERLAQAAIHFFEAHLSSNTSIDTPKEVHTATNRIEAEAIIA